jgi:hypothetical protein
MGGSCSAHAGMRNVYTILVGRSERKRPLGRPRRRWEADIKLILGDRVLCVVWINLAQNKVPLRAFVFTAMNLLVP